MKRRVSDSDTWQPSRFSACSVKCRKTQCSDVSVTHVPSPPLSNPSSQWLAVGKELHLTEDKLSEEKLQDGLEAEVNEPLGLKNLCTHEKAASGEELKPREQTELADGVGTSEPHGTPKLYHGRSMNGADTGERSTWSRFRDFLRGAPRVLCLVGAGLSAPSGLATWRGTNGLWNDINLKELASLKKFQEDPVTVWRFYGDRLLKSLAARPNAAHYALATLARSHGEWLTINQNVDGTDLRQDDRNSTGGALIFRQGSSSKPITLRRAYWTFTAP